MITPQLHPPCSGWQLDLPGPYAPPNVEATMGHQAPSHQDDVYLEIPRNAFAIRGILLLTSVTGIISLIGTPKLVVETWKSGDYGLTLIALLTIVICVWMVTIAWRCDISPPRSEPIRFNRARQRIYAYNFTYRWWNPFERWRVTPVAYDWSQVRAEGWKKRGATAQGAVVIKWGVVLSIVEPGTNKVIDRFPLSTMGPNEFAWAFICTYMQQGPSALPPIESPRDLNDVPEYNLALRLAPKVKWPADMDHESRTAP